MTSRQLLIKTYPFLVAKLLLGGLMIAVSAILLMTMLFIGWLFSEVMMAVMFALWIASLKFIYVLLMRFGGYFIKAGHIAVIAEVLKTNQIPEHQLSFGKKAVQQRFIVSGSYFVLDELISSAVGQIYKKTDKLFGKLDFIPGVSIAAQIVHCFLRVYLGYIDECCLGWTFVNQSESPFKSAADGVVIYAQNWKKLTEHAATVLGKAFFLILISTLFIFFPAGLLFKLLKLSGLAAFFLALLLTISFKTSVIDSWILIETMEIFMNRGASTALDTDLYASLSKISSSFKALLEKENE